MALTIVPEGIKLQKVSKAEKEAIEEYNNKELIKTLAGSGSAGIAVLALEAIISFALYKGIKFPNLNLVQSFATIFPQFSAVLGIERELTADQAAAITKLLEDPSQIPWVANLVKDKDFNFKQFGI